MLGRDPSVGGRVVHGFHRGGAARHSDRQPARARHSAAAGWRLCGAGAHVGGASLRGVANIGFNPTFGNRDAHRRDASARLRRRSLRPASRDRASSRACAASRSFPTCRRCWRRSDATSPRHGASSMTAMSELRAEQLEVVESIVGGVGGHAPRPLSDRPRCARDALAGTAPDRRRPRSHRRPLDQAGHDPARRRPRHRARRPAPRVDARRAGSRSRSTCCTRTSRCSRSTSRPGLVVHPAPGHWQGTLVSALLHRWPALPPGLDPIASRHRAPARQGHVGRAADREDRRSAGGLGRQFHDREIDKQYLALVWGVPRRAQRHDRRADRSPPRASQAHGGAAARARSA